MLLIGPPGSGKTERILTGVDRAIRAGRGHEVLVLVPTASMRAHLLSTLARRGLMPPTSAVTTMSEFVGQQAPDMLDGTPAWEDRLLAQVLARSASRWLRKWAGSSRLRGRIAALMRELWAGGADSYQLEPAVRGTQQTAFLRVFREYEETLSDEGRVHPNQRIAAAASIVRERGLDSVRTVYVDGFYQFTRQQEELLYALEEQAEEFAIAMPEGLAHYPRSASQVVLPPSLAKEGVRREIVAAPSPRGEVLEVARRILSSGRPMRDHAVVLRSPDRYADLLREVFESLKIPHRFWHRERASSHGVTRHFVAWLRVIHRQFPAEECLEAITSPLSPVGALAEADAFDFAVRECLPGSGLEFLESNADGFPSVAELLAQLRPCRDWHRKRFGAKRWERECLDMLDRLQALRPPVVPGSLRRTLDWRGTLAARRALRSAVGEAVSMPEFKGRKRPSLAAFVDAVEDVLRATSVRTPDERFDVVHILPVGEARQWSVPVAFACGLADGWFPRPRAQDVFFADGERQRLQALGVGIRTSAQHAEEERRRFEVASSRATEQQVLSYPRHDDSGRELRMSPFLAALGEQPRDCPPVAVGCGRSSGSPKRARSLRPALLDSVSARNASFNVSGIRDYRQCPYLYFSANTLDLRGRPPEPAERLDGRVVGKIVHSTIDRWNRGLGPIGGLLDKAFESALRELHLEADFRTERIRLAVRKDLERFAGRPVAAMAVPSNSVARFEEQVELRVGDAQPQPRVQCRIDRYDVNPGRDCVVTDYKYARSGSVKRLLSQNLAGEELQLALYLAALEQSRGVEPAGMLLVGLRDGTSVAGASVGGSGDLKPLRRQDLRRLLVDATQGAGETVGDVLRGRIEALPRDVGFCDRWCRFKPVCRVAWKGGTAPPDDEPGVR